jgi:hypothetical protein
LLSTVIWFCITDQVPRPPRILRIAVAVGLVLLIVQFTPSLLRSLFPPAVALLYFAALVPTVHAVAGAWSPKGWVGFVGGLAGWLTVSMLVPMHFVSGEAKLAFLVRGFEFALASHSYVVDSKRLQSRDLRTCYFFLLVNPVLVFHQFGKRTGPPTLTWRNIARCGVGFCTIAAYFTLDLLIERLPFTSETMQLARLKSFSDYGQFLAATGVLAASTYLAHSGTASVQIGTMRLAGYVVPERYNYAFLAVTPADWWRRWNTYVSTWFASYCLLPSMVFLRRHTRMSAPIAGALAILTCFVVSGLVHSAIASTARQALVLVLCFAAQALLVIAWLGASDAGRRFVDSLPAGVGGTVRRVAPVGSWALRVQVNMVILSFLLPELTGGLTAD